VPKLLRASQSDTTTKKQELLRAAEGGTLASQPETQLRATNEAEGNAEPPVSQPTFWQRLFGKWESNDA